MKTFQWILAFAIVSLTAVSFEQNCLIQKTTKKLDSLEVKQKQLSHQVDSLQSLWDANWSMALETEHKATWDHEWLRVFKQDFPWIDRRVAEDTMRVE